MIEVEGYKAFHGTMRITPKSEKFPPFELCTDWLYKPDTGYWYGGGRSFLPEICEIIAEVPK